MNDLEQRTQAIIEACVKEKETNPLAVFRHVAGQDFVRIHGPEHHVLDGACLLTALHNAGMEFDLEEMLQKLRREGLQMPGAMCGHWGVCGAVASVGAALALLEGTGPLTTGSSWGSHMTCTSRALANLAAMGGTPVLQKGRLYSSQNRHSLRKRTVRDHPAGRKHSLRVLSKERAVSGGEVSV